MKDWILIDYDFRKNFLKMIVKYGSQELVSQEKDGFRKRSIMQILTI